MMLLSIIMFSYDELQNVNFFNKQRNGKREPIQKKMRTSLAFHSNDDVIVN